MKWLTANKVKLFLKIVLYSVYGAFSGFYTPTFLLVAFNFMHGPVNNPDGEVLVPFGIFVLFTILLIDIAIVVKTVKSQSMTVFEKLLLLSLLLVAKFTGISMVEQNDLRFFAECFLRKFAPDNHFTYWK